jgi:Predicted permeases
MPQKHIHTNIILFSFPLWLFLFYFKDKVSYFLVFTLARMSEDQVLGNTLYFFLSTFLKILLLLVLMIFLMGVVRSFFSPEKTRKALEGKPLFAGNVMAGAFGILTPFCSCSAIPLFLGFVEAGIPIGVTFSFLIAAPMVNEVGVIMLIGLFGWKIGIIYTLAGLLIAVVSGWIIGKLKLERWVQDWVFNTQSGTAQLPEEAMKLEDRFWFGFEAVGDTLKKIWLYVIVGVAIGSFIHGYIPENYLVSLMHKSSWYSVPLSVIIGVPMYSCTAGVVPIASALIEKGVPLGTALAFMMSVIGISLPELIILKKVLKLPLILTFVGIIATGIIIVGYLFNIFIVH